MSALDEEGGADSTGVVGRVADVVVFAPLGLALGAREVWPELARRGRRHVRHLRRGVGRTRSWAGDRLDAVGEQAGSALGGLGLVPGDRSDDDPPPTRPRTQAARPRAVRNASVPSIDPGTLGIPDYDALSASQVVPRLAGLSADELEQVRRYESEGRARKTILNRIAQLQSG